jgi:coenzyme F420 hydrogenase subunit beta
MSRIKSVNDVVAWRMCIGCGACAYICPDQKVALWDFPAEGIRPVADTTGCGSCNDCLSVCPALETSFEVAADIRPQFLGDRDFQRDWGAVLAIWEGHATDEAIRFRGSSGGILTALAAYCIEKEQMSGVLHIGPHQDQPILNQTRLSRTRQELISLTGSRYSPASVANGLAVVESSPAPCAIIGKPGEIAAVSKAAGLRPKLREKVGLTMSFFCAETPATRGTTELLRKLGIEPENVADLRYRGLGWPGYFTPVEHGRKDTTAKMPYRESWAFLQRYRPWSIHLWPDGSGELADITCGDPWYEKPDGKNPGFSIVAARTERGRRIVLGAMAAGYVTLATAEPWKLDKSQRYLAEKKASLKGRRMAMGLLGLPIGKFPGAELDHLWRKLPFKTRFKAFASTLKRVLQRKLFFPLRLEIGTAKQVTIRGETKTQSPPARPEVRGPDRLG